MYKNKIDNEKNFLNSPQLLSCKRGNSVQIFIRTHTLLFRTTVYHSWNPNSIYNEKVVNVVPDDFVLSKINKRIQLATKTSIIGPHASEKFQVANYGIGGQYSIHLDPHDFYSTKNDGELQRQGNYSFGEVKKIS